jgi:hypothetical protein
MLSEAEVQSLKGVFTGGLIQPGNPRYETARRVWNGMVDRRLVRAAWQHQGPVC